MGPNYRAMTEVKMPVQQQISSQNEMKKCR